METILNQQKLKIGILSFYYPHLGGSGIISTRLGRNLARIGHEVHFIGYDTDENPQEMEELGIMIPEKIGKETMYLNIDISILQYFIN